MNPYGLALALLLTAGTVQAEVKPLPQSSWPHTLAEAVPLVLDVMSPTQRSIIGETSKDNLPLFMGEWGEDIEQLLGLNNGNSALRQASCGQPCTVDPATLKLMEAAWEVLKR